MRVAPSAAHTAKAGGLLFSKAELDRLVSLAERGICQLFALQKEALRSATVSG